MLFKSECDKFLENIAAMRSSAIANAVNEALQKQHAPYESRVRAACNAVIEEEKTSTAELIKVLQADLERKIQDHIEQMNQSIAKNKSEVIKTAEIKAKTAYDTFILGVGKLVDETNID